MSGGSQKTTQQQQSTSTNTIDPQQLALLQGNLSDARANAAKIGGPYSGQLTASFAPAQLQAQGILSGIGTDQSGQQAIGGATSAVQGILGNPVNGTINASPVVAGQLSNTDLSPYENPFTSGVINQTIAEQERARQIANLANDQQASAAGAFGGSRSGVINANTNEGYDRNTGSLIAGLNSDNFNQARTAAGQDIASKLAADQFNSTQGVNAQQASFNNALASAGLTMNAAGQIVALNQAGLQDATARGGILASVGDAQQQQQQSDYDRMYQEYLRQQSLPAQQQSILNSALGMFPAQGTTTTSGSGTTTQKSSPGLAGIVGGLLGGAQVAGDLGWAPFGG